MQDDLSFPPTASRLARTIRHPGRMLLPVVMRKIGLSRFVRCKTFWGGSFRGVLPEAVTTVIWRTGHFEPDVCRSLHLLLRNGDVYVDVGAHFGFFSLYASHLVGISGTVIAIEAMPSTREFLEANLLSNGARVIGVAASDSTGSATFVDYGVIASSLNGFAGTTPRTKFATTGVDVPVECAKLDDLLGGLDSLRLIKIDAESSEFKVLLGSLNLIRRHKPAIAIELGDLDGRQSDVEIRDLLRTEGYVAYRWEDSVLVEDFGFSQSNPCGNLLFVHTSHTRE
jgi:FkbM family methyltransferase